MISPQRCEIFSRDLTMLALALQMCKVDYFLFYLLLIALLPLSSIVPGIQGQKEAIYQFLIIKLDCLIIS